MVVPSTRVLFEVETARWVLIRFVSASRTMSEGRIDYRVRVLDGETELATATRTIYAIGEAGAADGGAADGGS